MEKDDIHGIWACIVGVTAFVGFTGWVGYSVANKIPVRGSSQIQEGYAIPNKLEIDVDDMDRNGKEEVLLRYDGTPYLLKLDKNGKPVIMPYKIIPTKIVPTEDYLDFEVEPLMPE